MATAALDAISAGPSWRARLGQWLPFIVLAPSLLASFVYVFVFTLWTLYISLSDSSLLPTYGFVGFENYISLWSNRRWNVAYTNLFLFSAFYVLGAMAVGLDDSLAFRSAEEGVDFPHGPQHWSFMERFLPAYRAELTAFAEVARGDRPTPCTVEDALQAFRVAEACELSRHEGRPVRLKEIETL